MLKPILIVLTVLAVLFTLYTITDKSCYENKIITDSTDRLFYEKLCQINSNLEILVAQKSDNILIPPDQFYQLKATTEYCHGTTNRSEASHQRPSN